MSSAFILPEFSTPLRILLVEDDELLSSIYEIFLQTKNVNVVSCSTLASAREVISQSAEIFDAAILDNQLDDGEGILLLPTLQKISVATAVLMVSANNEPAFFLHAFEAGIDDYMVKPVNLDLLWIKISKAVQQLKLKTLSAQQHAELENWVSQEQQQQELARHLFNSMFDEWNQPNAAVYTWLKPQSTFSGDAVLRCQGRDGSWYFMLADAMGHGLAPAISLMPMLQCFQAMSHKALPLANIVFELNSVLNRLLPDDRFVAAIVIRISPWSRQLEIWNGGMPAMLLLNDDGALLSQALSKHMALGILPASKIEVSPEIFDVPAIAFFAIYSDGLIETPGADGTILDCEQIRKHLRLGTDKPFSILASHFAKVNCPDDISICLVDCNKLFAQPAADTMLKVMPGHSFSASYTLHGLAIVNTDIAAKALDLLRAQNLPQFFLQQVFTVFSELYTNAFEHGMLGLVSAVKEQENGFIYFYEEKERRIALLNEDSQIEFQLWWSAAEQQVTVVIRDSGVGFGQTDNEVGPEVVSFGRGLTLISQLSSQVEVIAPGNQFRVVLSLADNLAKLQQCNI